MKAHRTDGVSLVFALIFLGVAGWWLVAQVLDLNLPEVGWILAGGLILVGVLGLLGALRSGRSTAAATPPAAPVTDGGPLPTAPASAAPGTDPTPVGFTTSDYGTADSTTPEYRTADFTTSEYRTAESTTREYGTAEFPRVDPDATDPVPGRPTGGVDQPRPDDHRD